ncbi:chromate efflux transporter [Leptolyngbya cf. ectocarpi LEGE 11479]|uniref:Chromate efflux transporter n=1 Tax=Leptolyngbya cf. ectocarpi LEGE 11479 TaxID=1828722 RepID=A0A928WXA4_LEPEC|nr:chromate efflux transporter [Leptolyngbya ectocarpi]MBE9065062.1 chromate efflux transporter [Leptolyngbya cf. ectocarpi LEGE 11479]
MNTQLSRLQELTGLFFKLGAIGFGGPQAHIAMINDEAVERRGWLSSDEFSDGLAVCEMLPGPASTQMGIYTGYVYGGWLGALLAGLAFITPAFFIVVGLSWVYFRFQQLPQLMAVFFGLSPVMIAIILGFCYKLGRKSIQNWIGVSIAVIAFLASAFGSLSTPVVFLLAGLLGMGIYGPKGRRFNSVMPLGVLAILQPGFWGIERLSTYGWPLFTFFLKVGTLIFGGGLVIIPLLEFEVVERLDWLSTADFINGVAIGQLSPGPVVLTAAFVGYKMAGFLGALISAVGIFTPSFLFIMLAAPLLVRLRKNPWVQAFLKGIKPAVVGAIMAAAVPLGQTTFGQVTWPLSVLAVVVAIAALIAIIHFKVTAWKLILGGAVLGLFGYPLLDGGASGL